MEQISSGHPVVLPEHVECSGVFTQTNAISGWWDESWTPVLTANQATSTHYPYQEIGNGSVTSPDCITDLTVGIDAGAWYYNVRRCRVYSWLDIRIVVNGVPVATLGNAAYRYYDGRTGGDIQPIPANLEKPFGYVTNERLNIPANATVSVEGQWRFNVNGAQATDAYVRIIGGLRSRVKFDFTPREVITGVE